MTATGGHGEGPGGPPGWPLFWGGAGEDWEGAAVVVVVGRWSHQNAGVECGEGAPAAAFLKCGRRSRVEAAPVVGTAQCVVEWLICKSNNWTRVVGIRCF